MDLLLRFRNNNYEEKYHEHIDAYLSKVSKTCVVLMFGLVPFYPYSLYFEVTHLPDFVGVIARGSIISFLYASAVLIPFIIHFARESLQKHKKSNKISVGFIFHSFWRVSLLLRLDVQCGST